MKTRSLDGPVVRAARAQRLVDAVDHERARERALARDERVQLGLQQSVRLGAAAALERLHDVVDAPPLRLAEVRPRVGQERLGEVGVAAREDVERARDDALPGQGAPRVRRQRRRRGAEALHLAAQVGRGRQSVVRLSLERGDGHVVPLERAADFGFERVDDGKVREERQDVFDGQQRALVQDARRLGRRQRTVLDDVLRHAQPQTLLHVLRRAEVCAFLCERDVSQAQRGRDRVVEHAQARVEPDAGAVPLCAVARPQRELEVEGGHLVAGGGEVPHERRLGVVRRAVAVQVQNVVAQRVRLRRVLRLQKVQDLRVDL
mmetsp:Transcript_32169/g.110665  ORF Transcript_32169/g.110665 Transcript_32169/m.110665 type:complete len:319 (+) Transcript_32169:3116-4072(+)